MGGHACPCLRHARQLSSLSPNPSMVRLVGILGLFFSIFFVIVSITIIVRQWLPILEVFPDGIKDNPDIYNYIIGGLVMAYGIFRFIRSYKMIRYNKDV